MTDKKDTSQTANEIPTQPYCICPRPRRAPVQITKQLSSWWISFWIWNGLHYALGLVATLGSVLVVQAKNNPPVIEAQAAQALGVIVAVCTAALTFLKSGAKANAYISAWRYLNAERIKYELDPKYTDTKLADEHKKGEDIIGKSD